jgi:RNA polymerase sigma factor (TIGR02999 family)
MPIVLAHKVADLPIRRANLGKCVFLTLPEPGYMLRTQMGLIPGGQVSQTSSKPVSELLMKWRGGDSEALRSLIPLVYDELRRVAHHHLRAEREGHTLQSTALVNEAYLRLMKQEPHLENRAHFFAVASRLMRQILVEYARNRNAAKRDGGWKLTLDEASAKPDRRSLDLVTLDDALTELCRLDAQQGRIVELRYFGGLSIEETAHVLDISPATVKRDWATARIWLHRELDRGKR